MKRIFGAAFALIFSLSFSPGYASGISHRLIMNESSSSCPVIKNPLEIFIGRVLPNAELTSQSD